MKSPRNAPRTMPRALAALIATTLAFACAADDVAAPPAAAGEDLVRNELRQVLLRLSAAGAFGAGGNVAMSVSLPPERFVDLGLVVDPRAPADEGVRVLGVTPGAGGHALGLRAGDVLTAVNGAALAGLGRDDAGNAKAVALLKRTVDALPDRSQVTLDVRRAGAAVALSGALSARYLPAVRLELGEGSLVASTAPVAAGGVIAAGTSAAGEGGCGRISTFHVAPRSQQLYAAKVLQIDGAVAGTSTQDTYRVAPGRHELLVSEQIESRDLSTTFSRRRSEWGRKLLSVDVAPGETVLIAARLEDARASSPDYWLPVVWKTVPEACR